MPVKKVGLYNLIYNHLIEFLLEYLLLLTNVSVGVGLCNCSK